MKNLKYKIYTILTIILIIVISCQTPKEESVIITQKKYNIKVIDSCEYIECDYGIFDQRVYSLTHKGNCKFCLERKIKQSLTD